MGFAKVQGGMQTGSLRPGVRLAADGKVEITHNGHTGPSQWFDPVINAFRRYRGSPYVETDREDYAPGEVVAVSGGGWTPHEEVRLVLAENPATHEETVLTAVVDAAGSFVNSDFRPDEHDAGVSFILTATGLVSGLQAQTVFTDAPPPASNYTLQSGTSAIVAGQNDIGNHCDDCTTFVGFPFPLTIYDSTFTGATVSSNGFIRFSGSNVQNGQTSCIPTSLNQGINIFGHWGDLVTDVPGTGIFTRVLGTAPNRTYFIEWRAGFFRGGFFGRLGDNGQRVNFELRFYESTNRFDVIYGVVDRAGSSDLNGRPIAVGVQRSTFGPATSALCGNGTLFNGLELAFTGVPITSPTVTTVTSSSNPSVYGGTVTFTATVTANANPVTAGTVTFRDGATVLASSLPLNGSGQATFATSTLGATSHLIRAEYSGTGQFLSSAGQLTQAVGRAPLTVTPAHASREYGGSNPTFTGTIIGIQNGDNIGANYATTATTASSTGSYPITAELIDPDAKSSNYNITLNQGTLTVTTAGLTIRAADATRSYGAANPPFTAAITGFANGDDIGDLNGTLQFSTSATVASNVGAYPITPSGLASMNYTITFVDGTLTITRAPLTIRADDSFRVYGGPNPAFTAQFAGFVNGDTVSALAGTLQFATSAGPVSPVGIYAVTPSGLTSSNYTITFTDGTLTVTRASLAVTADSKSRTYGVSNPALTATLSGFVAGETDAALRSSGALSGLAACTTTADESSPVAGSPYSISCGVGTLVATNYQFGPFVTGALTIERALLTITPDNKTKTYGQAVALTGVISGMQNGDTFTATYASDGAAATAQFGTGSYPITVVGVTGTSLGNYTQNRQTALLTISKAVLVIQPGDVSKSYGEAVSLAGMISGQQNGDTLTATYVSAGAAASAPFGTGTYPITVSDVVGPGLANYTEDRRIGTLTITKAVLTITPNTFSKIYAQTALLTGVITGQRNADAFMATYASAGAAAGATVGAYPISVSDVQGPALANYTQVRSIGTLSIGQAPLVVAAQSYTRQYSDPNPVFTGTIAGVQNGDAIAPSFASVANVASAVGSYPIVTTLIDPGGRLPNYTITILNGVLTVTQEDAAATYTGLMYASTASATSGTAQVTLRATIQDITAVTPGLDGAPGDVRTAAVQFVNRDLAGHPVLCTATLTLFDVSDHKSANAACTYTFSIGNADSDSFTIGVIVGRGGGNYTQDSSDDNTVLTISKPLTSFITGGGYLVLEQPTGEYAGAPGSRANFGFNAKSKGRNTLQGKLNLILRKDGRVYQVKSTAIESLSSRAWTQTAPGFGSFQGKGNLQDITNPLASISLRGNLTIQMTFTDNGEPGSGDTLAISVWDGGTLLYSSSWNGVNTIEQLLAGGNAVAR
jgi:hypothetical protein